jgi:hypothetical protein
VKETLRVINEMQASGIIGRYAIGDAVGALYYLEVASPVDIDIFVMFPTTSGALLSLSPIYSYLQERGFKAEKEAVVIGKWPVQFLSPAGELEEEAIREATDVEIDNVKTRVMTAEHLVAIALKTGRAKDHARIVEFIKQKGVHPKRLEKVLSRHGLSSKWQTFKRKYGSR